MKTDCQALPRDQSRDNSCYLVNYRARQRIEMMHAQPS
jgi:hypothetical protein